jgi:predicted dehydrogenase
VWTRFFPLSIHLQDLLFTQKTLGKIHRVTADLGIPFSKDDLSHRLLNPNLGGGALLDLGIYSLTWVFMTCFQDPENAGQKPVVTGGMLKTEETGVDEFTTISLMFPKTRVSAVASCNMTVRTNEDFCRIQGEKVGTLPIAASVSRTDGNRAISRFNGPHTVPQPSY